MQNGNEWLLSSNHRDDPELTPLRLHGSAPRPPGFVRWTPVNHPDAMRPPDLPPPVVQPPNADNDWVRRRLNELIQEDLNRVGINAQPIPEDPVEDVEFD